MSNTIAKVGIDLGTTNCVVVYCNDDYGYEYISLDGSDTVLPSVLYYSNTNGKEKVTVGNNAIARGKDSPHNIIENSKRKIGSDASWTIDGKTFKSEDVAFELLHHMYKKTIKQLKCNEVHAVVTVPAEYNARQKQLTKDAAIKAGFAHVKLLQEPVAAAIAYEQDSQTEETIFVVDLGGGTFDTTVLTKSSGNNSYDQVAIDGDVLLGGTDFDNIIYEEICKDIEMELDIDVRNNDNISNTVGSTANLRHTLRTEARKIKLLLSEEQSVEMGMNYFKDTFGNPIEYIFSMTRTSFEFKSGELLQRIEEAIERTMDQAKTALSNRRLKMDKVFLVGGSCKIPKVKELVEDYFEMTALSEDVAIQVAHGAALVAMTDITIGLITAKSLGIKVYPRKFSTIIPKGTKYPCTVTDEGYTTLSDNQKKINVVILEAQKETEQNCTYLDKVSENGELTGTGFPRHTYYGEGTLSGFKSRPAGKSHFEITFSLDADGVLNVTAKETNDNVKVDFTVDLNLPQEK